MQKKIVYLPLKVSLSFLILTEFLFWFGPIKYTIPNDFILFIYLVLMNFSLYFGYRVGVNKFRPSSYKTSKNFIKVIIVIGLVLTLIDLFNIWTMRGISISFDSFFNSLTNPGQAYYSEINPESETSIFLLLLSPIKWASIPLGISSWRKINKFYKTCIFAIFFLSILMWLGIGVRKGIFDLLIITLFSIIASFPQIIAKRNYNKKFKFITYASIILFLTYFIYSNLSRGGSTNLKDIMTMAINSDIREIYLSLPNWLIISLRSITGYLVQGYHALALSLNIGIRPIVPFGMSWFTILIANKLGYDPAPLTYMKELESFGIDMYGNWHTIYVWLANDFTFIGVPIIIFCIGYFFAQSWYDSLIGKNLFSFPVMTLFVLMVFYFYANNQVLSFSFIPFVVCFSIYKLSRIISVH